MNIERLKVLLDGIAIVLSIVGLVISGFSAHYTCRTMQAAEDQLVAAINLEPHFSEDMSRYDGLIIESDGKIQSDIIVRVYPYLKVIASNIVTDLELDREEYYTFSFYMNLHNFSVPILPAFEFFEVQRLNSRSGTLVSIQDSEYSDMLMEYLLGSKSYIEENYYVRSLSLSLEYFLELEYLDLLGNGHHLVYHVTTGFSEGVKKKPNYSEILNSTFEPAETSAETESNGPEQQADSKTFLGINASEVLNSEPTPDEGASEPVDLETDDIESIYHTIKKEIDSYRLSLYYTWWDWDDPIYDSTENSNRWHVLEIGKADSREDVYSNLVWAIQKQLESNVWKYARKQSQ